MSDNKRTLPVRPKPPPRRTATVSLSSDGTSPGVKFQNTTVNNGPTVRIDAAAKNKKERPLSTGLNKEFMQALDKKLVTDSTKGKLQRQGSEPNQLRDEDSLPLLQAKREKKYSHRRTMSAANSNKEKKQKQAKTANSTSELVNVNNIKRKSGVVARGKGKKLLVKLTGKSTEDSLLSPRSNNTNAPVHRKDSVINVKKDFADFLLCSSLQLMGINDTNIDKIKRNISQTYPIMIDNKFNINDANIIGSIQDNLDRLLSIKINHKSACIIQSAFRCFKIRSIVKPLLSNSKELQRLRGYARGFTKFIDVERNYCKNLGKLVNRYLMPARQKLVLGKEVIKLEEVSHVFSNCEIILEVHQELLKKLENIYKNDWPFVRTVGKVILDSGKAFSSYGVYVGNFVNSQETISRLRADKNGKFNVWIEETEKKFENDLTFTYLLSEPINHIEKMESTLELMSGYLPLGIEERQMIDAYTLIHETKKFVMEQLARSETTAVLLDIQRRIVHDKPLNIVEDDRKLLIESVLTVNGHKRIFILLSNALIVGRPVKNNQFKLKEFRALEVVQFEKGSLDTNFCIKTPTAVYKITGKIEEISQWVKYLTEYEESNKRNRTIGVNITVILDREKSDIPSIVKQCIERIKAIPDGTKTEGLFRISGEHNQIDALTRIFDELPPNDRDLSPYSIHAICGVLKLFFRTLPLPLFSFEAYDKIINIEKTLGNSIITDDIIQEYKIIINSLGKHLPTLHYLIKFLVEDIIKYSEVNMMTSSNLAIVFGPTLLRPEVETMESTLNSPLVNHGIQNIIENYDKLF